MLGCGGMMLGLNVRGQSPKVRQVGLPKRNDNGHSISISIGSRRLGTY
jgi:hypothetical protein